MAAFDWSQLNLTFFKSNWPHDDEPSTLMQICSRVSVVEAVRYTNIHSRQPYFVPIGMQCETRYKLNILKSTLNYG